MRFKVEYIDFGVYVDKNGNQFIGEDEKLREVKTNKSFKVIEYENNDQTLTIEEE